MNRSITSGFLSVVSTKVVVMALGLLTSPLLTRYLGGEYGDYAFLLSLFAIFMIFVSSGVSDGVRKYLAEERPDPNWDEHVVGFYFRFAAFAALIGAAALVGAAESGIVAERFGDERYRTYFYLLAGLVVTAQFREYARRTLMGFGLEPYSETLKVFQKVTFVGSAVPLAALGFGVPGALAGHILSSALSALGGFVVVARRVPLSSVVRIPSLSFPRRELLTFNGLSVVLVLLLTSLYHVDVMMLRPMAGSEATGYYKISLTLAELLWFAPLAMQTVLLHSTSSLWSSRNRRRISSISARVTRYTLLFTALLALGVAALAPTAIPLLYPDDYVASVTPLLLLLPGAVGFAVARPILAIGQGKGDLVPLILTTGVAAVLNLALNFLLIGRYGMYGAAVATSVGYGSMCVLHVWSARRLGFDPLADARLLRVTATAALSAVPIFYVAGLFDRPAAAVAVVPPVGAATFFAIAILTRAIDVSELRGLLGSVPGVEGGHSLGTSPVSSPNEGLITAAGLQKALIVVGTLFFLVGIVLSAVGPGLLAGGQAATADGSSNATDGPADPAPEDETAGDENGDGEDDADDGTGNDSDGGLGDGTGGGDNESGGPIDDNESNDDSGGDDSDGGFSDNGSDGGFSDNGSDGGFSDNGSDGTVGDNESDGGFDDNDSDGNESADNFGDNDSGDDFGDNDSGDDFGDNTSDGGDASDDDLLLRVARYGG